MNIPIHQILAHIHKHRLDSLGAHAQELGEQADAHAIDALEDVLHLQGAELLLLLALGPL